MESGSPPLDREDQIVPWEEFPGGLMLRILCFRCCGPDSVPGWGTEIPQAAQRSPPPKKKCSLGRGRAALTGTPLFHWEKPRLRQVA